MELFKVENWEGDGLDIKYKPQNRIVIQEIIAGIKQGASIDLSSANFFLEIEKNLDEKLVLPDINEPEGFSKLISLLKLDLCNTSRVDILWSNKECDQFTCEILSKYWDYIWYGASDEVCLLYFPDINIRVMITDYGIVFL